MTQHRYTPIFPEGGWSCIACKRSFSFREFQCAYCLTPKLPASMRVLTNDERKTLADNLGVDLRPDPIYAGLVFSTCPTDCREKCIHKPCLKPQGEVA